MKNQLPKLNVINQTCTKPYIQKQPEPQYQAWLNDRFRKMNPLSVEFTRCFALLQVLDSMSPNSRTDYQILTTHWELPGCLAIIEDAAINWESTQSQMAHAMARQIDKTHTIPVWQSVQQAIYQHGGDPDYLHIMGLISDFIRSHLNRRGDVFNGIVRARIETAPIVGLSLIVKSLYDYLEIDPDKVLLNRRGNLNDIIETRPSKYSDRQFYDQYRLIMKQLGCGQGVHDPTLLERAGWWYGCRITYNGVNEYCLRMYANGAGVALARDNVSARIRPYDYLIYGKDYPESVKKVK